MSELLLKEIRTAVDKKKHLGTVVLPCYQVEYLLSEIGVIRAMYESSNNNADRLQSEIDRLNAELAEARKRAEGKE